MLGPSIRYEAHTADDDAPASVAAPSFQTRLADACAELRAEAGRLRRAGCELRAAHADKIAGELADYLSIDQLATARRQADR